MLHKAAGKIHPCRKLWFILILLLPTLVPRIGAEEYFLIYMILITYITCLGFPLVYKVSFKWLLPFMFLAYNFVCISYVIHAATCTTQLIFSDNYDYKS
jgi:hypothetical protein